jgi:hypothetical protein
MLRAEGPFRSSFPEEDMYSIDLYHIQAEMHGSEFRLLLDRNIFARVVALAKGATATETHRIPAAIMAFAQCAGIDIDASIALYEGIATQDKNTANEDLMHFRRADHAHPSTFADIALGRASQLRCPTHRAENIPDLEPLRRPLKQYSFVYPLVLKIGLLELQGGPMQHRLLRFLSWSHQNWYLNAAATSLAALCFSHEVPRGILKDLRHQDRSLTLKGMRNCAWDLTYITWWIQLIRRQENTNCLYLLCSCDKALRWVAQRILAKGVFGERNDSELLRELLGNEVLVHYTRLIENRDDPCRAINEIGVEIAAYRRKLIGELEEQLLAAHS